MTELFPTVDRLFYGTIVETKEDNGRILYKVRVPQLHGDNVMDEDLPFVPSLNPGSMFGTTFSGGAMSVGQLVHFFKGSGQGATGFGTILGAYHPVINTSRELYGQTKSIAEQTIIPLEQQTRDIRLPPNLEKVLNENGVEVVQLVEKGLHSLSTLYGLATHGTQAPLNGVKIPKSSAVPTAKTPNSSVLSGDFLSGLPGTDFSLGNLMDILPKDIQDKLFANLPGDVTDAFKSIMALSQTYSSGNFGGAGFEGKRVDESTLILKVFELLKNIKDPNTLISALLQILTDPSISGQNSLAHFMQLPNMFGNTNIKLNMDGSFDISDDAETKKLTEAFGSLLSGFQSSAGTLFDSVPQFGDMLNRMTPDTGKGISDIINTIKTDSPAEAGNIFVRG